MSRAAEKEELLLRLARTRSALGDEFSRLGDACDVPKRFHASFNRHPFAWIGGGVALGTALTTLLPGKGRNKQLRSLLLGGLGLLGNRLLDGPLPPLARILESALGEPAKPAPSPLRDGIEEG